MAQTPANLPAGAEALAIANLDRKMQEGFNNTKTT
jgi:hypothetical protein